MEPGIIQLGLVIVVFLQTIYYSHKLPPMIASHFGAGGVADRWSSTSSLFATYWLVVALVFVVYLVVPYLIGALPRQLINLPNKDYWLSDEMYPHTMSRLRAQFRWLGVILLLFLVLVFQMVFQANLSQSPELGAWFVPGLIGFLIAIVSWGIKFTRQFSRTS
jgi:uncharacterized membrane protein